MNRRLRQRIALVMSLMMMIFTICQTQVLAAIHLPAPANPAMAGCHDMAKTDQAPPQADCHSECQHLQQHPGVDHTPVLDWCPMVLTWLEPLHKDVGSISLVSLAPHSPVTDPPPAIRFQRFRE
jgi:hypothetical protein